MMEPAAGSCWLKVLLQLSRALLERLLPGRWLQLIVTGWAQLMGRLPVAALPEDEPPAKELLQAASGRFLLISEERLSRWEADLLDSHINNMVSYVWGPGAGRAQCVAWAGRGYSLCDNLSALQEALCKIAPEEPALHDGFLKGRFPSGDLAWAAQSRGSESSGERRAEIQHVRMKRLEFLQQSPSPDPDHGYCSLEEVLLEPRGGPARPFTERSLTRAETGRDIPPDEPSHGHAGSCSSSAEDLPVSTRPMCSNKLIDYILGAASSDEDDTGSCSEDDEEDDDGFSSEGTASDCDGRKPEHDERLYLWNPFYTAEPHSPQTFTAKIQADACRENASVLQEALRFKAEMEDASWCESLPGSPCSSSEEEHCDESADEAENLKLWNSFSKCDDPYNPLNFKAPFETAVRKQPDGLALPNSQCCAVLPYRVQPTESHGRGILNTRQHWALPEASIHTKQKKVTFLDQITEYYISSEEDRKGCWEEFARDRCRFQKRIQETEEAIGYCLSTDHRQKILDQLQKYCS